MFNFVLSYFKATTGLEAMGDQRHRLYHPTIVLIYQQIMKGFTIFASKRCMKKCLI